MSDTEERVHPFSTGTQYYDWQGANCERCTRYQVDDDGIPQWDQCEIFDALSLATFDDGTVSRDIAERMGYFDNNGADATRTDGIWAFAYCWPCGEVDWTEDWKREYCRRHPEACGQLVMPV